MVNPYNIVRYNRAAGSTHFGFWYRTEGAASGPSSNIYYCPNRMPMGEFHDNVAHDIGR